MFLATASTKRPIAMSCLLIALIAAVIAVPVYAAKGEQVQKGASYSLDDVKPVDGKTADRDEEPKK